MSKLSLEGQELRKLRKENEELQNKAELFNLEYDLLQSKANEMTLTQARKGHEQKLKNNYYGTTDQKKISR